jgi:hypothetical protein
LLTLLRPRPTVPDSVASVPRVGMVIESTSRRVQA